MEEWDAVGGVGLGGGVRGITTGKALPMAQTIRELSPSSCPGVSVAFGWSFCCKLGKNLFIPL